MDDDGDAQVCDGVEKPRANEVQRLCLGVVVAICSVPCFFQAGKLGLLLPGKNVHVTFACIGGIEVGAEGLEGGKKSFGEELFFGGIGLGFELVEGVCECLQVGGALGKCVAKVSVRLGFPGSDVG